MDRAVIFSGGYINDYSFYKKQIKNNDFIFCADGGIKHVIKLGLIPDIWVGDFDSCDFSSVINSYPFLKSSEIIKLNTDKDETDTQYCCQLAFKRGFSDVVIWGALGGRVDHTLANISMLEFFSKNSIDACLEDEKNTVRILTDEITIKKSRKYFSIIPLDDSIVIEKTDGLLYNASSMILFRAQSRGVSNEIIDSKAYVKIKSGKAVIIESDD